MREYDWKFTFVNGRQLITSGTTKRIAVIKALYLAVREAWEPKIIAIKEVNR